MNKFLGWVMALFAVGVLILSLVPGVFLEGSGGAQIGLFLVFAFFSWWSFRGHLF